MEIREEFDGAVSRILIDATTPIHFWMNLFSYNSQNWECNLLS
jgi:hypothetical protein